MTVVCRSRALQQTERVSSMVIDLRDPDFWQDPYPTYAEARARARCARTTGGELVLLRADDLDTVHVDHAFGQPGVLALERLGVHNGPFYEWRGRSMAAHDGSVHTRLRSTVVRAFTPMRVERLRASLGDHARTMLTAARRQGSFDVVTDYASDLPLWLICEFLGLPVDAREEIATFLEGTESGFTDPLTADKRQVAEVGIVALGRFVGGLIAEQRDRAAGRPRVRPARRRSARDGSTGTSWSRWSSTSSVARSDRAARRSQTRCCSWSATPSRRRGSAPIRSRGSRPRSRSASGSTPRSAPVASSCWPTTTCSACR